MNAANFNQTGGFPLETETLAFIQNAYKLFNDLGNVIGDKSIIKGCALTGTTVSDGTIYVNGELLEFRGGTQQTKIVIREDIQYMAFEDGTTKAVYKTRYAKFGTGTGAILWSEFTRPKTVLELSNATLPEATETQKGIVELATNTEANSNDDTKAVTPKALNNRLLTFPEKLHGASVPLGDAPNGDDELIQINIPNVGTSNYVVMGHFTSVIEGHWNYDNDIIWIVAKKTATYFKIGVRELAASTQNVYFDFILIKL